MKKTLELILAIASISAFASTTNIVRMTPLATFVAGTNAVLVAANRYTDEHGGSGSGISASVAGTIATNTVDAKVAPWAMKGQPKPGGGGADTNTVKDIVHEVVDPYTVSRWMRPDDWCIDYTISNQTENVTSSEVYEDSFRIVSNVTYTALTGRGGKAFGKVLDPYSRLAMNIREWKSLSPNLTINPNGVFSSTVDGIHRIRAAWSNCYNYADIAIQEVLSKSESREYYIADKEGSVRKAVNDGALAILNSATVNSTNTYDGIEYVLWNTFIPRMTSVGVGNVALWAASPHVLVSAWHYNNKVTGSQTFDDGNGNVATVTKLPWVNLETWALSNLTNSFTVAEIKAMGIEDIAMIPCVKTSGAVPDGCIPYFIDKTKAVAWFGDDISGLSTWTFSQSHNQAIPTVASSWGTIAWIYKYFDEEYMRADIWARVKEMGTKYPIHGGDSGKPTFFIKDGQQIIFTGNNSPRGCFIDGFPAIKEFIKAYGDEIKEAN